MYLNLTINPATEEIEQQIDIVKVKESLANLHFQQYLKVALANTMQEKYALAVGKDHLLAVQSDAYLRGKADFIHELFALILN